MNSKFYSNTFWVVGGSIIKALLGLIISIITARFLGPSNYGIIGYITTITTLFSAFANLGFANVIIKEYVSNKGEAGKISGTAITLQFISSLLAYICIILFVLIFNINDKTMIICAIIQGSYHIFNSFECINYYYQSQLKSKIVIIITLVAYFLVQVYRIYLIITSKSIIWFSFAAILEPLMINILLVITYIVKKSPKFSFSKEIAKRLLKQSAPFILAGFISVIYASIDKIMLKEIFNGTDKVGFYNVAYNLSHSWVFLLTAIITSFSPIIYGYYGKNDATNSNLKSRQLYFIIFLLSFIVSVCFIIIAPFVIPLLYTKAYNDSILPAILLVLSIPFAYIGVARNIQIVSENLQKYTILFSCFTVILNICLNLIFIPILGATGAALGTLISEFFVCMIIPLFFKKTRHIGVNIVSAFIGKNVQIINIKNTFTAFLKNKKNHKKNAVSEECNEET